MRVIIAGANGFVGSSLVNRFVENEIKVLAIDLSFTKPNFKKSNLIFTIESDLTDIDELCAAIGMNQYDVFYNFAWLGVNGPNKCKYDIQLNNIMISLRCAELAKKLGCKKYLCAGTIAERAIESVPFLEKTSPGMMYAAAKFCNRIMLENYCKNIGLDFVWMQFSNIYGPNNKTGNIISYTLTQLKQNLIATFGPANQPYDFIYIDDLIEAIYRLGINNTNSNFYFIGSGSPMILKEYLLKIGYVFGKPELIQIGAREDDNIKYSFDMMDISKLKNDIGEYISGSFDELIKYTIDHF